MHLFAARPDEVPLDTFESFVVVAEDEADAWRCMVGATEGEDLLTKRQTWTTHLVVADLTAAQVSALYAVSQWAKVAPTPGGPPVGRFSFVVTSSFVSG